MNHKQYLLDLLDGGQSLSHEGVGMVIDYISRLEAVAELAKLWPSPTVTARMKDALAALKEKR